MKEIKIEWCENFIKAVFAKIPYENGGIEMNLFWEEAEKAGLWERDTYGSPMSKALEKLVKVKIVSDKNGNYLYTVFKLA